MKKDRLSVWLRVLGMAAAVCLLAAALAGCGGTPDDSGSGDVPAQSGGGTGGETEEAQPTETEAPVVIYPITGYCNAQRGLNVRKKPPDAEDPNYEKIPVIGGLAFAERITIYDQIGEWYKIHFNVKDAVDGYGYVHVQHVVFEVPETTSPPQTTAGTAAESTAQ